MTDSIVLGSGDRMRARMPSQSERTVHRLAEDEPVVEIHRRDGTVETYDARQVELQVQCVNGARSGPFEAAEQAHEHREGGGEDR
jgi:hypothetical protein